MTGRGVRIGLQALALAGVAGLLVLLVWKLTHDPGGGIAAQVAKGKEPSAPNFTLRRLDGRGTISLASFRGKPVVIDFWASWCWTCPRQSQRLQAALARYKGVVAVGVDTEDSASRARRWLERYRITYPSVHDGDGKVLSRWGGLPIPKIFFIDRDGKVVGQMEAEEDLPRFLHKLANAA